MSRNLATITFLSLGLILCSCNNSKSQSSNASQSVPASSTQDAKDEDISQNDDRLNNASLAKRPKGKMSYFVNGQQRTIDEKTVQCMYVGMNSTMAQSVISGGNEVTIIHMGLPKVGEVEIKSIASMPSVGIQVIIDGVQYNNKTASDAKLAITKVTPAGKNYYVGGTFSGKLTSLDGSKTINITNGVFESGYL